MSVSLGIHWADGKYEEVPIAGMRTADELARDARRLGLALIPQFPEFIPVEPQTLDTFIYEVTTLRNKMASSEGADSAKVDILNRLIEAFGRLKAAAGWKASIG